jgi:hypothetical protein
MQSSTAIVDSELKLFYNNSNGKALARTVHVQRLAPVMASRRHNRQLCSISVPMKPSSHAPTRQLQREV